MPVDIFTVSSLPADTVPNLWSQDHQEALYDQYIILPSYYGVTGAVQMPVQGRPTDDQGGYGQGGGAQAVACEIVQVHAPMMQLTIGWEARRFGQPLASPDPRPPSRATRYTLLRYQVLPPSPMLEPDGLTNVWVVGGM